MNARQQRYLLLGIILISFFLSGQFGGGCFNVCRTSSVSDTETVEIIVSVFYNGPNCGGGVSPMASKVAKGDLAEFTFQPGNCKVMSASLGTTGGYEGPVVGSNTITIKNITQDNRLTVTFHNSCVALDIFHSSYPLSEDCIEGDETPEEDTGGGTPVITDGEPDDPLSEEDVYPLEQEEEQGQGSGGPGCKPSGAPCSPIFSIDPSCCSGYCADGGCN